MIRGPKKILQSETFGRVQPAVYQKEKKKDYLITACKYFHMEKTVRTNWLVNLAQKGMYETNHYMEDEAKFK